MQSLFQWFDGLMQGFFIKTIIGKFEWIDWMIVFSVLIGLLYGVKRGIMRALAEILEIIIIIFLVMMLHENVALFLSSVMGRLGAQYAPPVAFMITMSVVFLSVAFLDGFLRKLVHTQVVAPIRILGGAVFGCVHSLLVIGLMVQGLYVWPSWGVKKVFEAGNSAFGYQVIQIAPKVHEVISESLKFIGVPL